MNKGLTLSIIFEAQSLNYGESIGNVSELKKITRADGRVLTFSSRQSIRYDIVRLGHELYGWNLDVVNKEKGTMQFKSDATIGDSVEMDLFGYMKTSKGNQSSVRSAVVRLTHAVSLESYRGDLEFLSNMGLASRIGENADLANIEQHASFYTYTLTADLAKVGVDENDNINLPNDEKLERITQLLEIIKVLNRHIRGRVENLSPLFVIGGVYDYPIPYFLGRIKLEFDGDKVYIVTQPIEEALNLTVKDKKVKDYTYVGLVKGIFENENDFSDILGENRVLSIEDFFTKMKEEVKNYYEGE